MRLPVFLSALFAVFVTANIPLSETEMSAALSSPNSIELAMLSRPYLPRSLSYRTIF